MHPTTIAKLERQQSQFNGDDDVFDLQANEAQKRRESELRKYAFFQLKIQLVNGINLVAMDKSGM